MATVVKQRKHRVVEYTTLKPHFEDMLALLETIQSTSQHRDKGRKNLRLIWMNIGRGRYLR